MGLADYRRKRRFDRTSEPKGRKKTGTDRQFVVQQHAARRLHFDFRIELDGVLKSWAVPKGISLDPADRRLAVHVEDHPVEYASFEGVIPEGEYGAGAVIVWDRGTWEPIGDPHAGLSKGTLKFHLHGEKLQGAWTLVRMRPRPGESGDNWLLIKERDEYAAPAAARDIVLDRPESVLSGRILAEVAAGKDPPTAGKRDRRPGGILELLRKTTRARNARMPESLDPALGRLAERPPKGDEWLHEIKFDGYRILCWLDHGKACLRTRHGLDWSGRFPEIAAEVERLPANLALLDGEIVAQSADGISSFSALQQALSSRRTGALVYQVFDVVYLEGFDLRQVGLESRKAILQELLSQSDQKRVRYVDHVEGGGSEFLAHCRKLGLEGIMSKRRNGAYPGGRSDDWRKLKCVEAEPFVIGGYTTPVREPQMRALLVGYHDARGRLMYAGRVGSGFTEKTGADLERRLQAIQRPKSPFAESVPKEAGREIHWVHPQLVAQVQFAGWTHDDHLRHPAFQGLRDDTESTEVVRESAADSPRADAPRSSPDASQGPGDRLPEAVARDLAEVRLTNPQKVLYADVGLTKLDLVRYYVQIADWILPHISDRPLTLVRCPQGRLEECFFQKHAGRETPKQVHRVPIEEDGKVEECLYVNDLKGLVSLVQVSVLEIHNWGSRIDRLEQPDRLVFDLDPAEAVPWPRVIEAARRIRERLDDLGLVSFVKTTGGKGLHVVVPLERRQSWDELKRFSQRFAASLAGDYPQAYTANMAKRARQGKIYIDYVRNGRGATAVAPYSTRARGGAPVATPVNWDELTPALRPNQFTVNNLAERLMGLRVDPWAGMQSVRQAITAGMQKKV